MPADPPQVLAHLVGEVDLVAGFEWHDSIGSTSSRALEAAAAGAPEGLVVGADVQREGRGRRGRPWYAPAGTSLLVSVLLRPTAPRATWPTLALMAGTAVHRTAETFCPGARAGLKWPNDLLLEGRKAAGVLVESAADAVVVGIGVNVDWRGVERPEGLVATSLAEVAGRDVDRGAVLRVLLTELDRGWASARTDPGGIVPAYVPRCATVGTSVVALGVRGGVRGTAVGLTPDGHLRIRDADGVDTIVSSGEVEHLR